MAQSALERLDTLVAANSVQATNAPQIRLTPWNEFIRCYHRDNSVIACRGTNSYNTVIETTPSSRNIVVANSARLNPTNVSILHTEEKEEAERKKQEEHTCVVDYTLMHCSIAIWRTRQSLDALHISGQHHHIRENELDQTYQNVTCRLQRRSAAPVHRFESVTSTALRICRYPGSSQSYQG